MEPLGSWHPRSSTSKICRLKVNQLAIFFQLGSSFTTSSSASLFLKARNTTRSWVKTGLATSILTKKYIRIYIPMLSTYSIKCLKETLHGASTLMLHSTTTTSQAVWISKERANYWNRFPTVHCSPHAKMWMWWLCQPLSGRSKIRWVFSNQSEAWGDECWCILIHLLTINNALFNYH